MSPLANEIRAVLPSLRRYAFALTGHRRWGDRYIEIALETLLAEPTRIHQGDDVRFKLYELLHDSMGAVTTGAGDPEDEPEDFYEEARARRGVLSLPLAERKMVLLVLLEGFAPAQAAALVRLPLNQARRSLNHAIEAMGVRTDSQASMGPVRRPAPAFAEHAHAH
jgi:RNA polymerase sigma-70 factor, ECF subfamily